MSSGPVITAVVMHTRFSFPKYRLDTPPTGRILDDSEERRQRVLTYHPSHEAHFRCDPVLQKAN